MTARRCRRSRRRFRAPCATARSTARCSRERSPARPSALKRLEAIVHPMVVDGEIAFLPSRRGGAPSSPCSRSRCCSRPSRMPRRCDAWWSARRTRCSGTRARAPRHDAWTSSKHLLARQLPDAEKRARADFVVDSGTTPGRHARARSINSRIRSKVAQARDGAVASDTVTSRPGCIPACGIRRGLRPLRRARQGSSEDICARSCSTPRRPVSTRSTGTGSSRSAASSSSTASRPGGVWHCHLNPERDVPCRPSRCMGSRRVPARQAALCRARRRLARLHRGRDAGDAQRGLRFRLPQRRARPAARGRCCAGTAWSTRWRWRGGGIPARRAASTRSASATASICPSARSMARCSIAGCSPRSMSSWSAAIRRGSNSPRTAPGGPARGEPRSPDQPAAEAAAPRLTAAEIEAHRAFVATLGAEALWLALLVLRADCRLALARARHSAA